MSPSNYSDLAYTSYGGPVSAYSAGTTVHMKVVCAGNEYKCYVNLYDGKGETQVLDATDNSFPNGGDGFRAENIENSNHSSDRHWTLDNFRVGGCGDAGFTPTITSTPQATVTPSATPLVTSYTYDGNGNLTQEITAGNGTPTTISYSYNFENRLSKVVDASGNATTYVYGYDGNLLKTATSAGATTYVYGQGIVPLMIKSSGVTQKFLQASGKIVSEWDGSGTNGNRRYFYADALGSVAGLTDKGATIVQNMTYDPYGRVLANSGSVTLASEYVGAYGVRDTGTLSGRYTMGVREYDASLGRFLSEDPLGYKADGNVFRYAANNPMRFTDPTGLTVWTGDATYYNLVGYNRADGQPFDPNIMAGAMTKEKVSKLGTTVTVKSKKDCKTISVVINDRGPFARGDDGQAKRPLQPDPGGVIDLTPAAFKELAGSLGPGRVQVEVTVP